MAIREGMIGLATADSGRSPKHVAPFGGREPRLGTNPISIAVPSDLEAPFYLDMATSAVAAGKIAVAVARNGGIPKGWIIDKPQTPRIIARAARCCRSAVPRAIRDLALLRWWRCCADLGIPAQRLPETPAQLVESYYGPS